MSRTRLILIGSLMLLMSAASWAHKASDGFVYLDQSGDATSLRVDLALRDLVLVVPLDTNQDRQITGRELNQARADITRFIEAGIALGADGQACRLTGSDWGLTRHSDGPYASARYAVRCPDGATVTSVTYSLLFDIDSLHRGLLQRLDGKTEQLAVLGPDAPTLSFDAQPPALFGMFVDFLKQGIIHLLLGFDHLLFLLVLILPATLNRREAPGHRRVLTKRLLELGGIISSFTVAHSITLALAALDIVRPPVAWIEIIIALSIALTAANLFFPVLGRKTWRLAFGFGLIHGFGFASVLGDLTSGTSQIVLALAGFNMGVEVGQIALVVLVFPLLYSLSQFRLYQRAAVPAIALIVSAMSLYWVVERVAGLPGV